MVHEIYLHARGFVHYVKVTRFPIIIIILCILLYFLNLILWILIV